MRRALSAIAQTVLLVAVGWFVWGTLRANIAQFGTLDLTFHVNPGWVGLSAVTVLATYGLLIRAWTLVLDGWGQGLPMKRAASIWCLSNLGRYLPGKVWSVAGMVVLAKRAGVSGWAAAASAIVMQFLAIATGAGVFLAFVPSRVFASTVSPVAVGTAGLAGIAAAVVVTTTPLLQRLARLVKPEIEFRPLRPMAATLGAGATVAAWLGYGLALWLLARGVVPATPLPGLLAVGGFAGAYIVGLVFIFAPGGVGVREGVLVSLLTPSVGGGAAVVIAVASRLLMTLTEIVAAIGAWWLAPEPEQEQ